MQLPFLLLAFAVFTSAYQVTYPGQGDEWLGSGSQTLKWSKVDTDRDSFAVFLTNTDRTELPKNNLLLKSNVDGFSGSVQISLPSGYRFDGKTFRVNLCRDDSSPEAILAQSPEFKISTSSKIDDMIPPESLTSPTKTSSEPALTSSSSLVRETTATTSKKPLYGGANKARPVAPINLPVLGLCTAVVIFGAFLV